MPPPPPPGPPLPPAGPPGPPGPPGGGGLRRGLLVGLAAIVLGAGVGGVWALALDSDGEGDSKASGQSGPREPKQDDSADAESPPPSDSSSPAAPSDPPPGYTRRVDPEGFTLDVPEGWERREESRDSTAAVVYYETSDQRYQLQFFWVEDPTPYDSLELAEKLLTEKYVKGRNYERVALHRVGDKDGSAGGKRETAEWEYTYDNTEHGRRYVIDRRFEGADGELYSIGVLGPEGERGNHQDVLKAAYDSFCPDGSTCSDPASP